MKNYKKLSESLQHDLDCKNYQLRKNESYFSVICETLEINHKSKLTEIQKAIINLQENSIPISKIEYLIANCNDKTNFNALEDDLQTLIDEAKQDG